MTLGKMALPCAGDAEPFLQNDFPESSLAKDILANSMFEDMSPFVLLAACI